MAEKYAHRNFFDDYRATATDSDTLAGQAAAKATITIDFDVKEPEKLPSQSLFKFINDGVIGACDAIDTPFGTRKITYADYTASGRALSFIEDYLRDEVLPV